MGKTIDLYPWPGSRVEIREYSVDSLEAQKLFEKEVKDIQLKEKDFYEKFDREKRVAKNIQSEKIKSLVNELNDESIRSEKEEGKEEGKEEINQGNGIDILMQSHLHLSEAKDKTDENNQNIENNEEKIGKEHIFIFELKENIAEEQSKIQEIQGQIEHEMKGIQESQGKIAGYSKNINHLGKEIDLLHEIKNSLKIRLAHAETPEEAQAIEQQIEETERKIEQKEKSKQTLFEKIEDENYKIEYLYQNIQKHQGKIQNHLHKISQHQEAIGQHENKIAWWEQEIHTLQQSNKNIIKDNEEHLINTRKISEDIYQKHKGKRDLTATAEDRDIHRQHETLHKVITEEIQDLEIGKREKVSIEHFLVGNILTQSIMKQRYTGRQTDQVDQYIQERKLAA